jgi:hypothetical protein
MVAAAAAAAPPAGDASAALAALHAAGDDLEALAEAIERASFLDATPGDDRQKLRGVWGRCCICTTRRAQPAGAA